MLQRNKTWANLTNSLSRQHILSTTTRAANTENRQIQKNIHVFSLVAARGALRANITKYICVSEEE